MNHYIDEGKQAVVTAAAAIKAGDIVPVVSGKIYGIAHLDIPAGTQGVVDLVGKYELAKAAVALSAGDVANVGTDGTITSDTSGTYAVGIVAQDAASGGSSAIVYFDGLTPAK